jgi:poly(A) polymerase
MRTCTDVLNRLLHDVALDLRDDTMIGYSDRFKGCMEISMSTYATEQGDIPFHRILYFRAGSQMLWHKETRFDVVFNSTDQAASMKGGNVSLRELDLALAQQNRMDAEEAARLESWIRRRQPTRTTFNEHQRIFVHRASRLTGEWVSLESCAQLPVFENDTDDGNLQQLSFNTWNVLSETYLPDALRNPNVSKRRWYLIAEQIANDRAQFWIFTEVCTEFASYLLSTDVVKRWYSSSAGPANDFRSLPSASVGGTGQLILVRRDVAIESVYFTDTSQANGKRLTHVVAILPNGLTLALCAVHLTSGPPGSLDCPAAVEKRRLQLKVAIEHLDTLYARGKPCQLRVVAGDFNFKTAADEAACASILEGFIEADPGLAQDTFVPPRNCLARLGGSGATMRLDRIYMKSVGCSPAISILSHEVFGTDAFEMDLGDDSRAIDAVTGGGMMISDHFGIQTVFSSAANSTDRSGARNFDGRKSAWTSATALAILPTDEIRNSVDKWMRGDTDPSFSRWPAHCNLLFPFVNPELVGPALAELRAALIVKNFASELVELSFAGVSSFRHKVTTTVHLQCNNVTRLRDLHSLALEAAERVAGPAPSGRNVSRTGTEYNPHLKLATLRHIDTQAVHEFIEVAQKRLVEIGGLNWSFLPRSLVVLQNTDGRMTVVDEVRLRQLPSQASLTKQTLIVIRSICQQVFRGMPDFELHPVGSAALLKGRGNVSDVDVVVLPPSAAHEMTPSTFAKSVQDLLAEAGNHTTRFAGDAETVSVDLQDSHSLLPVDIMFGNTKYSYQARQDAETHCKALEDLIARKKLSRDVFTSALCQVKTWARAKMLTQRAYGLWSGIAWSVMMLAVANTGRHESACDLLRRFFLCYSQHTWSSEAVSINGPVSREKTRVLDGHDCSRDGAVVLSSGSNVLRGVSATVANALQKEMKEALQQLLNGSGEAWSAYAQALSPKLDKVYPQCVIVQLQYPHTANFKLDRANVEGWLKGKFVLFSRDELGERGICVRPSSMLDIKLEDATAVAELCCGVDEERSCATLAERGRLVLHAKMQLNDRFLRWDERPPSSSLHVFLREKGNV